MTTARTTQSTILIVSEAASEAALVQSLLEGEVDNVLVATSASSASDLFQQSRAPVLVLAYRDLQEALQVYLGLYRNSADQQIAIHSHRAIALCDRKDVKTAYDLCNNALINDYVQFWPNSYDTHRLLMSVKHALQAGSDQSVTSQTATALAVQAQRLAQLEGLLADYMKTGAGHAATAGRALAGAETSIAKALEGLSTHLLAGKDVQLRPGSEAEAFAREVSRYAAEAIMPHVRGANSTLQPLNAWVDDMEKTVAPHIHDSRAQLEQALAIRPVVLVVDDDEFQRRIVGNILSSENYQPEYASSGAGALSMIGKARPDLILMDIVMPDMSGLEAVGRLKGDPAHSKIPIIMTTGKREREIVLQCVKLGVSDFIVKPIDRKTLLGKIGRLVAPGGATSDV